MALTPQEAHAILSRATEVDVERYGDEYSNTPERVLARYRANLAGKDPDEIDEDDCYDCYMDLDAAFRDAPGGYKKAEQGGINIVVEYLGEWVGRTLLPSGHYSTCTTGCAIPGCCCQCPRR